MYGWLTSFSQTGGQHCFDPSPNKVSEYGLTYIDCFKLMGVTSLQDPDNNERDHVELGRDWRQESQAGRG